MKIFIILNILLLVAVFKIYGSDIVSKDKEVKGKVVDEFGEPFAGVIVESKDAHILAITNSDGKYSISIPENSQLVFKFLENTSDTISTTSRTIVNYKLIVDAN